MEGVNIDSRHGGLVIVWWGADEVKWLGGLSKFSETHGDELWLFYSSIDVRPTSTQRRANALAHCLRAKAAQGPMATK